MTKLTKAVTEALYTLWEFPFAVWLKDFAADLEADEKLFSVWPVIAQRQKEVVVKPPAANNEVSWIELLHREVATRGGVEEGVGYWVTHLPLILK